MKAARRACYFVSPSSIVSPCRDAVDTITLSGCFGHLGGVSAKSPLGEEEGVGGEDRRGIGVGGIAKGPYTGAQERSVDGLKHQGKIFRRELCELRLVGSSQFQG